MCTPDYLHLLCTRYCLCSSGGKIIIDREGNVITMPELATAGRSQKDLKSEWDLEQ
jgi:hypothetical protein